MWSQFLMSWSCVPMVICLYVFHSDLLALHWWHSGLPAALGQLAKVKASRQTIGHSEWSESVTLLLWQEPLHSTARRSVWGRVMVLSGFGAPRGVTCDKWMGMPVCAKRTSRYASEVKQEAFVCNGCFLNCIKVFVHQWMCVFGEQWVGREVQGHDTNSYWHLSFKALKHKDKPAWS